MADIVESWLWRDPAAIIDRLLQRSSRQAARAQGLEIGHAEPVQHHDRYYTMGRRASVRQAMKRVMGGRR